MKKTLCAIYENYRLQILNSYAITPSLYDPALVYAFLHRMEPVFHQADLTETYGFDPFSNVYRIKRPFIDEIINHIDIQQATGNLENLNLPKLEDKFGTREIRMELKNVCDYARLSGLFNENVWSHLERNAPIEYIPIAKTYPPEKIKI